MPKEGEQSSSDLGSLAWLRGLLGSRQLQVNLSASPMQTQLAPQMGCKAITNPNAPEGRA